MPKHSGLEYCVEAEDQYCMYKAQSLKQIEPLAPATLKTCHIKSPKIKDLKTLRHSVYIRLNIKLIPSFVSFDKMVSTGSCNAWAEQHALYTSFLLKPANKESNVQKLKSS